MSYVQSQMKPQMNAVNATVILSCTELEKHIPQTTYHIPHITYHDDVHLSHTMIVLTYQLANLYTYSYFADSLE